MKKAFIIFIICLSVCVNFVACKHTSNVNTVETSSKMNSSQSNSVEAPKKINLSQSNIGKYVNIQLVFGNVERSYTKSNTEYAYCMCYIIVSPKSDYDFESASITCTIYPHKMSSADTWIAIGDSGYSSSNDSWVSTIYLDKYGYGISSVYLEGSSNSSYVGIGHPLIGNQWDTEIFTASGCIAERQE